MMMRRTLLLLALGCAGGPDTGTDTDGVQDTSGPDTGVDSATAGTCDAATGGRTHWVVDSISFTRLVDGTSDGFDLDGHATGEGNRGGGCGIDDVGGPDGEEGIDNAFGALIPILEKTEFVAAEGLIQDTIRSGALLLLGELSGLDDRMNDDCVQIAVRRAKGVPKLGTDGAFLAGQTLDLDTTFDSAEMGETAVVDGLAVGGPFTFRLPLTVLNATLELEMLDAKISMRIDEDGDMSGVFAGGVDIDALLGVVGTDGIDQTLVALLAPAARAAADLAPDEDGNCTQLSLGLSFTATPVYIYDDVWAD